MASSVDEENRPSNDNNNDNNNTENWALLQKKLSKCERLIENATTPDERAKWEKKRLEYQDQLSSHKTAMSSATEMLSPPKIKGRISIVKYADPEETSKSSRASISAAKEVLSPSFARHLFNLGLDSGEEENQIVPKVIKGSQEKQEEETKQEDNDTTKKKIKGRISIDRSEKEINPWKQKLKKVDMLMMELFDRFEGTPEEFYESKDYKRLQKKQAEYSKKLGVASPVFQRKKTKEGEDDQNAGKKRSSLALFRAKARKLIMLRRVFAGRDYDQLGRGEQRADQASLRRTQKRDGSQNVSSCLKSHSGIEDDGVQRTIQWKQAEELVEEFLVEDLTRRDSTWGNIWEELYWSDEEMAEMRYEVSPLSVIIIFPY